jgi:hypothetical protein
MDANDDELLAGVAAAPLVGSLGHDAEFGCSGAWLDG